MKWHVSKNNRLRGNLGSNGIIVSHYVEHLLISRFQQPPPRMHIFCVGGRNSRKRQPYTSSPEPPSMKHQLKSHNHLIRAPPRKIRIKFKLRTEKPQPENLTARQTPKSENVLDMLRVEANCFKCEGWTGRSPDIVRRSPQN